MLAPLLLAVALAPQSHHHADESPINCSNCASWNAEQAPFKIHGNSYYVGVNGLSSVLITSSKGHILIDGGLPQSAELIAKNIEQLGFSIKDVKVILNSHAHFDHAGGLAALQRMSGAQLFASEDSAQSMKSGKVLANDPQAGYGDAMNFPAISNISIIGDGKSIEIGKNAVTAIYTPGHSPGGTSWSWPSCEADKCINIVFADSLNSVSDDVYKYSAHPDFLASFQKSIETVRNLKCDIIIAAHPSFSGLFEKAATESFIDVDGCRKYAGDAEARLNKRLAEEVANEIPEHSPDWAKINLAHNDVLISAGVKGSTYAELVRANPDGSCEFKFYQPSSDVPEDGYFHTGAKTDEQIDGGASDYFGYLLKCDYTSQTALVREYDLTKNSVKK